MVTGSFVSTRIDFTALDLDIGVSQKNVCTSLKAGLRAYM